MKGIRFIAKAFLVWRTLLFVPLYFGHRFLEYRSGYEFTNIWHRIAPYFPVSGYLLYPWANFDGVHYLSIAGSGYGTEARFFPLYPLLIRYVSRVFGKAAPFGLTQFTAGLLIANICFFFSLIVLYKLIRLDYSKKITRWSIIFLLIFPTSFYFGSIYSESLFLLLLLLSFYSARKKQWLIATFFGSLLAATRLVGIVMFPVLLYEFIVSEKVINIFKENDSKDMLRVIKKSLPLYLMPLGLLGYSWFNLKKWGNALHFVYTHGELANSRSVDAIVLFPQTMFRYLKMLIVVPSTQFEWWIVLLEISTFIAVAYLLYFSWKKKIWSSYILFALLAFLIPVSSGTFTALPRYVLILFPIFISLALVKRKTAKMAYLVASIVLLFVLLMFFSRGYFIA